MEEETNDKLMVQESRILIDKSEDADTKDFLP